MLVVGPDSGTLPNPASFVVSTAKTVLLRESKAATMFRVGEIAISPGELPALIGASRGIVSLYPLIITKAGKVEPENTPCEARTRLGRPLGGFFFREYPQETRLKPAHRPSTKTRTYFFKRQAPNDMKKEDLIAKWWIIADPGAGSLTYPQVSARASCYCMLPPGETVRKGCPILYSHKLYGGRFSRPD
jgi:hypothetical protein